MFWMCPPQSVKTCDTPSALNARATIRPPCIIVVSSGGERNTTMVGTDVYARCPWRVRIALVVAVLVALPAAARAQSFYLRDGRLYADGVDVGEATGLLVRVDAASGTHARARFDGTTISFDAELDVAVAHLQVGVGADT